MAKQYVRKKEEVLQTTVTSIRHNEYYNMQKMFDELYEKSSKNESFESLMPIILSKENILLAYRNIKTNGGSITPGTDKISIKDLKSLSSEEIIENVRHIVTGKRGYNPRAVRRKDIPKPNGETRPLGIPCMWDRLIQQCIKQVMEPICEAKFSNHSYGFRPGRSTENAIAELEKYNVYSNLHYVIEFDIKGFFDNVDHKKLIKQIWALGIHDKQLIYVIKQILSAPIMLPNGEKIRPLKGTPQGGIISPLLANIVLNELDHWIESQWENNPVAYKYSVRMNKNGSENKGSGYRAMKKTKLKEMYIVRYADDFRIVCRNKKDSVNIKIAVTKWLKDRLNLDISEEKTKIVNIEKQYCDFLGFKIGLKHKRGKFVTESHVADKNLARETEKLKKQIKRIAHPADDKDAATQTYRYNSMVMGMQNYYQHASHVNKDFAIVAWKINDLLLHELKPSRQKGRLARKGRELTPMEKERYGKSKTIRYDSMTGIPIYPIGYVQTKAPSNFKRGKTPYTEEGRKMMHKDLSINTTLMHELMKQTVHGSIEYADNRISLFSAQHGKCAITGVEFRDVNEIHCHHKIPKSQGGTDEYQNLMLVLNEVHILLHATSNETIQKYSELLQLDPKQKVKLNKYRKLIGLETI
ncbi:group II intron reverse transcriptase/maturase [Eubacterium sp. An3]|uniref:group II intron reverse transcriptase/maturase n=1 Tax=Eubacterium sp. An3 TaxID=1965628 RepID=UPI000B39F873|nr:group II intron reverse transcriptase/maturase [Eubacterium sp. An3]OUO28449.1 group II intron reverse transcriptase/maturase [Eubacterium sp. An3]